MNWIIQSFEELDWETGESLFWNNEFGWVDRKNATVFTESQRKTLNLPMGRYHWVEKELFDND